MKKVAITSIHPIQLPAFSHSSVNTYNMNSKFNIPVLFIIFNRPDTTLRVFDEIKKIKPSRLYVVADGPRENKNETELCQETKNIIDQVDWKCKLSKNYSDVNLGCKKRVSSGIDWFFENEEQGIILEDDCLPDPTFFKFCEEMLERYRDDDRIGMVSGNNFQFGKIKNQYSYYFSKYAHIWGWATWKRAWKNYDVRIKDWPEIKHKKVLNEVFRDRKSVLYWSSIFEDVYKNKIDTWDYQWSYACFKNKYLSVMPCVNLVSNIGFGQPDSTHTKRESRFSNMQTYPLSFPLSHPVNIVNDIKSDKIAQSNNYSVLRYFIGKLLRKLKILKECH